MALTRRFLKELLADREDKDDLIDQIIDLHVQDIAPLKVKLSRMEAEHGSADKVRGKYERLTAELEAAEEVDEDGTPWRTRYEALCAEYEAAKAEGDKRDVYEEKAKAYRSLLLREGVNHSVVDTIVRGSGHIINGMEMQGGKVRNHETVCAAIRSEFKNFIGPGPNQRR